MIVASGVAGTSNATFLLESPEERLGFSEASGAVFVPKIDGLHLVFVRNGSGERDDFVGEAHVVVKLVDDLDGFFAAAANGVIAGDLDVGNPVGVHRETRFHESTDGGEVVVSSVLRLTWVYSVVHEEEAGAIFRELHEAGVVVPHDGVGVAVDNDGGGSFEDLVILGPTRDDLCLDGEVALRIETLGEKKRSGTEFVIS